MSNSEPQVIFGKLIGDLSNFAEWWNKQSSFMHNGKYRIVYVDYVEMSDIRDNYVRYLLQMK